MTHSYLANEFSIPPFSVPETKFGQPSEFYKAPESNGDITYSFCFSEEIFDKLNRKDGEALCELTESLAEYGIINIDCNFSKIDITVTNDEVPLDFVIKAYTAIFQTILK